MKKNVVIEILYEQYKRVLIEKNNQLETEKIVKKRSSWSETKFGSLRELQNYINTVLDIHKKNMSD